MTLCGFTHGGDRSSNGAERHLIPQSEIASQLGISERALREMLAIERKLTPEVKEMLDAGILLLAYIWERMIIIELGV